MTGGAANGEALLFVGLFLGVLLFLVLATGYGHYLFCERRAPCRCNCCLGYETV